MHDDFLFVTWHGDDFWRRRLIALASLRYPVCAAVWLFAEPHIKRSPSSFMCCKRGGDRSAGCSRAELPRGCFQFGLLHLERVFSRKLSEIHAEPARRVNRNVPQLSEKERESWPSSSPPAAIANRTENPNELRIYSFVGWLLYYNMTCRDGTETATAQRNGEKESWPSSTTSDAIAHVLWGLHWLWNRNRKSKQAQKFYFSEHNHSFSYNTTRHRAAWAFPSNFMCRQTGECCIVAQLPWVCFKVRTLVFGKDFLTRDVRITSWASLGREPKWPRAQQNEEKVGLEALPLKLSWMFCEVFTGCDIKNTG